MKCVCPMGGDRTCPDDCPTRKYWSLSKSDRKAQRKAIAEQLHKQGYTQQAIATQLGVSQSTIRDDLSNLVDSTNSKRAKTESNPKGAGRPQGKSKRARKSTPEQETVAAKLVLDDGATYAEAGRRTGLGIQQVKTSVRAEETRREERADPQIDRSELSLTAQEKLDAAIRQHKKKLDSQFYERVNVGVQEFVDATILPDWRKKISQANKLYEARKALMTKDTFNTIRRALHPDSRQAISVQKLGQAFDAFMALEKYLLNEKDSPTAFGSTLPQSYADWQKAKRDIAEKRAAKRAANIARR